MFKMIGGDGREYGPVTAEQLRDWILDHRANGQTLTLADGETEWRPLAARPEFAATLAEAARAAAAGVPTRNPPVPDEAPAAPVAGTTPTPWRVLDCVSRGWGLFQQHALVLMAGSLTVWMLQTVPMFFGRLGAILSWVVSGPLYGGLCVLGLHLVQGVPARVGDVFACFNKRFVSCRLVWLVTSVLIQLGLALFLAPGIALSVLWAFALPLAADRGADPGAALQGSWRMVWPRFFPMLGLLTLAFLPTVVFAAYALVVMAGIVLQTLSISAGLELGELIEKLREALRQVSLLGFQQHVVWLLNLPFAWAVTMTAFEDWFGTSRRHGG